MPPGHGSVEPRRLDITGEQQELETIGERDLGGSAAIVQASMKLRRSSARLNGL